MPHAILLRSAAARAPVPAVGHCRTTPPLETPRHSKSDLTQPLQGLCVLARTGFFLSPLGISGRYGV